MKVSSENHALDKVVGGRFQVSQFYLSCITTVRHKYNRTSLSISNDISTATIISCYSIFLIKFHSDISIIIIIIIIITTMTAIVYECLHGLVPPYLTNDCVPVQV